MNAYLPRILIVGEDKGRKASMYWLYSQFIERVSFWTLMTVAPGRLALSLILLSIIRTFRRFLRVYGMNASEFGLASGHG